MEKHISKIYFTEEQRDNIKNSIKEYEEGKFVTDDVAEKEIQKLLMD